MAEDQHRKNQRMREAVETSKRNEVREAEWREELINRMPLSLRLILERPGADTDRLIRDMVEWREELINRMPLSLRLVLERPGADTDRLIRDMAQWLSFPSGGAFSAWLYDKACGEGRE